MSARRPAGRWSRPSALAARRSGWLCWLIIALALTLDITIGEMLSGLWSALGRLQDWIIETIQERQGETQPGLPISCQLSGI